MASSPAPILRACFLTLLLLLSGVARAAGPDVPPSWFWGCWKVMSVLPTSNTFGLSPKQQEAIIGRHLLFEPTLARSGKVVIRSPKYSVKVLSNKQFFKFGFYIPLSEIGVHKRQVTEITLTLPDNLSDEDFPGNDVFLRDKDIVIEVEGDFFVAQRVKPADLACGHNRNSKPAAH